MGERLRADALGDRRVDARRMQHPVVMARERGHLQRGQAECSNQTGEERVFDRPDAEVAAVGGPVDAEIVQVVAGPQRLRPARAVPGERGVDQARIERAQAVVVDAEPPRHPRTEALDQHVAAPRQLMEHGAARLCLEIDADAALPRFSASTMSGAIARAAGGRA
jgi:hypothetical protein